MLSGRLKAFFESFPVKYLAIIFTVVVIIYGGLLRDYFIADDFNILRYVYDAPHLKIIMENFTGLWLGGSVNNIYRPVATILFCIFQQIFGNTSLGYHLVLVLGCCFNSCLVFLVAHRLLNKENNLLALSAGILYAVFPSHPNVVMLVSSLHIVLYTLFSLVSLLFYLIYRQEKRIGKLIISFAFFYPWDLTKVWYPG
jgi:4-amino-4-deoxy-L-arabinose transferase-like glycosyltransferase